MHLDKLRNKSLQIALMPFLVAALGACSTQIDAEPVYELNGERQSVEADNLYDRGVRQLRAGRVGLALQDLRRALFKDPTSVPILNAIAISYDQLNRHDISQRYYQRSLAVEPDSMQTLNNLARSLLAQGKPEQAMRHLDRAAQMDESNDTVFDNLAQAKQQLAQRKAVAATGGSPRARSDSSRGQSLPNARVERMTRGMQRLVTKSEPADASAAVYKGAQAANLEDRDRRKAPVGSSGGEWQAHFTVDSRAKQPLAPPPQPQLNQAPETRVPPAAIAIGYHPGNGVREHAPSPPVKPIPGKALAQFVGSLHPRPGPRQWQPRMAHGLPPLTGQVDVGFHPGFVPQQAGTKPPNKPTVVKAVAKSGTTGQFVRARKKEREWLPGRSRRFVQVAAARTFAMETGEQDLLTHADLVTPAMPARPRGAAAIKAVADWRTALNQPWLTAGIAGPLSGAAATVKAPPIDTQTAALATPKDSTAPVAETHLMASEPFTLEVSNGAGRRSLAKRMGKYLKAQGLPAARLTNASHFSHQVSTLYYRPGYEAAARRVVADLPIPVRLQEQPGLYDDVRLKLGGDLLEFDRVVLMKEKGA